jgi:hypothetical protein
MGAEGRGGRQGHPADGPLRLPVRKKGNRPSVGKSAHREWLGPQMSRECMSGLSNVSFISKSDRAADMLRARPCANTDVGHPHDRG